MKPQFIYDSFHIPFHQCFFRNYPPTRADLIDSHASLQRSNGCKLNNVAWDVELTYLHIVVKCESLLGGHGKEPCNVTVEKT